jgi:hypothetical protein
LSRVISCFVPKNLAIVAFETFPFKPLNCFSGSVLKALDYQVDWIGIIDFIFGSIQF